MSYEHILTDLDDDGILTVTLHRPEAMNAWTMTMTKELVDMVEKADANDDVRAVVVTGSGEEGFDGTEEIEQVVVRQPVVHRPALWPVGHQATVLQTRQVARDVRL